MSLSKTLMIVATTLFAPTGPAVAATAATAIPGMNFFQLALLAAIGFAFSIRNRKG